MLAPGTMIGSYRIVTKLGEGGMSAVYVGEHALLPRSAAIKVLLPRLSANKQSVKRFFNEARAVSLISDPGIVQIFDFGYHADDSAFLVMELLDGEAMDKRLRRIKAFPVIECLRLGQLMCTALEAAHREGIVHCDLKPGNTFLVADRAVLGGERVKLLDFGIAKLLRDESEVLQTRAGMLMGTPAYMSPEQCRGRGNIDARSDIYSLACVMFTMLTGRPPFRLKMPGELVNAHLNEPAPRASSRLPELPAAIDDILQRCLAKSPDDRFPTMAVLAEQLAIAELTLFGSATASPPPAPVPPLAVRADPTPTAAGQAVIDPARTTLQLASGASTWKAAAVRPVHRRSRLATAAVAAAALCGGAFLALYDSQAARPPAAPAAVHTAAAADPVTVHAAVTIDPVPAITSPAQDAQSETQASPRNNDAVRDVLPSESVAPPASPAPPQQRSSGHRRGQVGTGGSHAKPTRADSSPPDDPLHFSRGD